MIINKQELRLALVTGLSAGLGLLNSIPFGIYLPLTTAAVLSSSYGGSLKLGIQRLLGSLMGIIILIIFSRGLNLPLPLGIGLALASTRFFGGILGLQVGYKVAGNIIVMGWLVHEEIEIIWGPLRLFWTGLGIVISLWATQYIWPTRNIPKLHQQFSSLLDSIALEFQSEIHLIQGQPSNPSTFKDKQSNRIALQQQLTAIRRQQADAQLELGANPEHHPLHNLWSRLDLLASQLLSSLWTIRSLSIPSQKFKAGRELSLEEAELIKILCSHIRKISHELKNPKTITQQELDPKLLREIKHSCLSTRQWIEQVSEQTIKANKNLISQQQLRQLVVRNSLIDHIRSALLETCSSAPRLSD